MRISIRELILCTLVVALVIALCLSRLKIDELKVFRGRAVFLQYLVGREGIEIEWHPDDKGVSFRKADNPFDGGAMSMDLKTFTLEDFLSD